MAHKMRPGDMPALPPAVFAQAVLTGLAAGEAPVAGPSAADQPLADGSVSMLRLPENAHTRARFALKRHFAHDETAFRAALARFRALMDLFTRGALRPWCRPLEGGRTALHPAVMDVASQLRLSGNGHFAPRKFQAAVAEMARIHYPHLVNGFGGRGAAPE